MLVRREWPSRPTFANPFAELNQLRRAMLRLIDAEPSDTFAEPGPGVFPPMNISQDDDNFYVRGEIPGIKATELAISALRNRVSVSGKREIGREHEKESYHRKERPEGSFSRVVTLPSEVDTARIEARYQDGILTLTLPKAEETKPRQIVVKT